MKRAHGPELVALQAQVQRWRQQRKSPRSRVPEAIWREAVRIAEHEGVHATCKALHFNYYDLKKRVQAVQQQAKLATKPVEHAEPASDATFVQLEVAPSPDAEPCSGRVVVELTGRGGERMRIEASDAGGLDMAGMVQAFWSRAS